MVTARVADRSGCWKASAIIPPAATAPNVAGGTVPATQTSDSTLQELLHPAPIGTPRVPLSASPLVVPAAPGVAPDQQPVVRLREGQNVWNRVGRLVKDEKTGQWMFTFDADGKEMKDPPVGLLPCRMLMAMEKASEDGAKSVRFRISGEVTEYHGKNYMIVRYMQTVRDLNQF